MNSIRS